MKKVLVAVALLVGLGVLAQRLGQKMLDHRLGGEVRSDAGHALPKWMFRNITTIRENTDRILEILDPDSSRSVLRILPLPESRSVRSNRSDLQTGYSGRESR